VVDEEELVWRREEEDEGGGQDPEDMIGRGARCGGERQ
jgi:hypothetical protein